MMGKLLKYDLKACIRTFGMIWGGMILMTALSCGLLVLGSGDNSIWLALGGMSMIPLVIALAGSIVFAYIYMALRFYNGLLGQEGYLMFTLPTTPFKLLTSKFLSALFFEGITMLLFLAGMAGVLGSTMYATGTGMNFEDLKMILEMAGLDFTFSSTMIWVLVATVLEMITRILQIYFACCLGHLCRGKRVLFSILFYFALNYVVSIFTFCIELFMINEFLTASLGGIYRMLAAYTIPMYICLGVVYYFFSARILRNKLNLE